MATLDDSDYDETNKHASLARQVTQLTIDLNKTEQYCRSIESQLQESQQQLQAQQGIVRQGSSENKQLNSQLARNETIIKQMEKQLADLQTQLETVKVRQKPQNSAEQESVFVPSNSLQKPLETNSLVEEIKVKKADQAIYNTVFIQETVLPRLEGIASTTHENQCSLQDLLTMGVETSKQIHRLISLMECKERTSDSSGLPWSSEVRMTGLDVNLTGDFGYPAPELFENEHPGIDGAGCTSTQQDVSPGDNTSMSSTQKRDIMASFPIFNHDVSADMNNLAIAGIETTTSSSSSQLSNDNESHQGWQYSLYRLFGTNPSMSPWIVVIIGFYLCFDFIMILWGTKTPKYKYIECRVVKI